MHLSSSISSRQLPVTTMVSPPSRFITDSYVETSPRWLHPNWQQKKATLQAKSSLNVRKGRAQHKYHRDRKIHFEPKFVPDQWLFVDERPLISSRNTTEGMATARYNKFQLRKANPFCIIRTRLYTGVTDVGSVYNTVPIHQITAALGREATRATGIGTYSAEQLTAGDEWCATSAERLNSGKCNQRGKRTNKVCCGENSRT